MQEMASRELVKKPKSGYNDGIDANCSLQSKEWYGAPGSHFCH
jgi:hypothetical protein